MICIDIFIFIYKTANQFQMGVKRAGGKVVAFEVDYGEVVAVLGADDDFPFYHPLFILDMLEIADDASVFFFDLHQRVVFFEGVAFFKLLHQGGDVAE